MRGLFLISFFIVSGSALYATDLEQWGTSGDWNILIDPESGNGCLASKQFEDGLIVEIGAAPDQAGGFFAAYNPEWTIEEGATGVVSFDFEDAQFAGDAVAAVKNDIHGAYAFFDNPEFVKEFGKRHQVVVTASGDSASEFKVDLAGSTKAIQAVLTCQDEQPEAATN